MRENLWIVLLLLAAMLTGCGQKQDVLPERETIPAGTQQVTPEPAAVPEPSVEVQGTQYQEALDAYAEVLDQNCDVIYNGFRDDEDYPYISGGVMESVMYHERGELLRQTGYTFDDISGDGIPELLIGAIPGDSADGSESTQIYSGYTLKDGAPVCFLEGWGRNYYLFLGDGRFYNYGSGGAAYSAFGTFRISPDGTELQCEDLYFSAPKLQGGEELSYYHNTTGVWDTDEAEELDMSGDDFWSLTDSLSAGAAAPELTPFADYAYTGYIAQPLSCKVRVDYLDDAAFKYPHYDDASEYMDAPVGEYETTILFQSAEGVKDFSLLALTLKAVDENGKADFDVVTVFSIPSLRAGVPLAVPMSFPGDLPNNGFSYTDADGTTQTYAVSISGRDGSLEVTPLD